MKNDPLEMRDVAGDPGYAKTLREACTLHNEYVSSIVLHPDFQSFGEV